MERADVESATQRGTEDARVHDTGAAQGYGEPRYTDYECSGECVEAMYKKARVHELAALAEAWQKEAAPAACRVTEDAKMHNTGTAQECLGTKAELSGDPGPPPPPAPPTAFTSTPRSRKVPLRLTEHCGPAYKSCADPDCTLPHGALRFQQSDTEEQADTVDSLVAMYEKARVEELTALAEAWEEEEVRCKQVRVEELAAQATAWEAADNEFQRDAMPDCQSVAGPEFRRWCACVVVKYLRDGTDVS